MQIYNKWDTEKQMAPDIVCFTHNANKAVAKEVGEIVYKCLTYMTEK